MVAHGKEDRYVSNMSTVASESEEFVVVSAADSSHYKSLCQFLLSLFTHEPKIKAIVFDLGLKEYQSQCLQDSFPKIDLRSFDYSIYPDYLDIRVNAGEYAWKPVIVYDVLNEFKSCVCWMDAGNIVTKPLKRIRTILRKVGMYSPRSSGRIVDWTHPKTLEFLGTSKNLLGKNNLNGACVAVSYNRSQARDIIAKWKDCALTRDCIAPPGSSRKNHRQDQAVLSVLSHQTGITENMPSGYYGFKIHQDID